MIFGEELVEHFDIVGWDPRGTGRSEPVVDCIDDYDKYFAGTDVTPDDEGERQQLIDVSADLAARCTDNNDEMLQFVGTNSTARDIDTIRRALGEDEISYLGFSYGSELGAAWVTLFPETVRAAVLDSPPGPTWSFSASCDRRPRPSPVGHVPRRVQRQSSVSVPQRWQRRNCVRRAHLRRSTRFLCRPAKGARR